MSIKRGLNAKIDFDGDGKADPGIVDSTGNWNLFLSARFYLRSGPWYLVLP